MTLKEDISFVTVMGEFCPPKYMLKSLALVSVNVTLFENRVFADVINLR